MKHKAVFQYKSDIYKFKDISFQVGLVQVAHLMAIQS